MCLPPLPIALRMKQELNALHGQKTLADPRDRLTVAAYKEHKFKEVQEKVN